MKVPYLLDNPGEVLPFGLHGEAPPERDIFIRGTHRLFSIKYLFLGFSINC